MRFDKAYLLPLEWPVSVQVHTCNVSHWSQNCNSTSTGILMSKDDRIEGLTLSQQERLGTNLELT